MLLDHVESIDLESNDQDTIKNLASELHDNKKFMKNKSQKNLMNLKYLLKKYDPKKKKLKCLALMSKISYSKVVEFNQLTKK